MTEPRPITERQLRILKPLMANFAKLNAFIYKKTNGRWMNKFAGRDICLVTMTGAKSGKQRDVPLMYVPYGDGVILVASLGGAPRNPTWYYNLVAHPDIEVRVKGRHMKLRARRVDAVEKARLWPVCIEHYPDYDLYQRRTGRDIPVFLCEPR
jgi:deazaflavin-dependent oxidoreductase (nitroreductase family)